MQVLFALGAEQVYLLRLEERHNPQSADGVARLFTDEAKDKDAYAKPVRGVATSLTTRSSR